MEEAEYKGLMQMFSHSLASEEIKFDRKNLKRSEPANLIYYCNCSICIGDSKDRYSGLTRSVSRPAETKESLRGFSWLLEKLSEIGGENICKLNIPDTAVFRKGKASFVLQYQRDRTLKFVNSGEKINNQEIIKNITNIVRNRKKEETQYKTPKTRPTSVGINEYGKETACIRLMGRNKANDLEEIYSEDENGAIRVMNENEFTGLMGQRPGSNFWKTIAYIQSTLKCKKGIGEPFVHTYYFTSIDANEIIKAGLEDNEEIEENIFLSNPNKYCEFIFKRIYYLFEKYLNLLLVKIKGEFVRDDNNRIWLICASDIIVTQAAAIDKSSTPEIKVSPVKYNEDQLLNHLAYVAKQPKNTRTEKFSKIMYKECEKMIEASHVMDAFKPAEPDLMNTTAFAKLRKFTPYSLEDLLDTDKAKTLLKVYTDKKRHEKRIMDFAPIQPLNLRPFTLTASRPNKLMSSWVFTPKGEGSPIKIRSRPNTSKFRHTYSNSFNL